MSAIIDSKISVPKGERAWLSYMNEAGDLQYIITTKSNDRKMYYRYNIVNGKCVKAGRNQDPTKLYD